MQSQQFMPRKSSCFYSPEYLKQVAGHRTVPVEVGTKYTDDEWGQQLMTVASFVDKYISSNQITKGYLAQHQLFDQVWFFYCTEDWSRMISTKIGNNRWGHFDVLVTGIFCIYNKSLFSCFTMTRISYKLLVFPKISKYYSEIFACSSAIPWACRIQYKSRVWSFVVKICSGAQ